MSQNADKSNRWLAPTWTIAGVLSVIWWAVCGQGSVQRGILLACLSLSSFMIGSLVGFLFSSYGEEVGTLGKIRDWLIGAVTALTVLKVDSLKTLIAIFAGNSAGYEYAYALGNAILFAGLGFYFMYFYREIILNVLLAQSRAQRGKLEGSQEAGHVVRSFQLRLPASVLTGIEDIDEVQDMDKEETEQLKRTLYSDDVESFLDKPTRFVRLAHSIGILFPRLHIYVTTAHISKKMKKRKRQYCWHRNG